MLKEKEFAAQIKEKYPSYASMDDTELVDKVLEKYPVYAKSVQRKKTFEEKLYDVPVIGGIVEAVPETAREVRGRNIRKERARDELMAEEGLTEKQAKAQIPKTTAIGTGAKFISNLFENAIGEDIVQPLAKAVTTEEQRDVMGERLQQYIAREGEYYDKLPKFLQVAIDKTGGTVEGLTTWAENLDPATREMLQDITLVAEPAIDIATLGAGERVAKEGVEQVARAGKEGLEQVVKFTDEIVTPAINQAKKSGEEGLTDAARFTVAKTTGLEDDTIRFIIDKPDLFDAAQRGEISRDSLFEELKGAIDSAEMKVSELGDAYKAVREGTETIELPKGEIEEVLTKRGLALTDEGITEASALATNLTPADIKAVNEAYDMVKGLETLNADQILNLRNRLDALINWKSETSKGGETLIKQIRKVVDDKAKENLEGLSVLDAQFAPAKRELQQLKRDYFKADGSLKDNAVSKLANLTNTGREQVLDRLKAIVPDIDERINALKAIADVERAASQKVGAYGQIIPAVGGAAAGGPVGAAIGLGVSAFLTNPKRAANFLKKIGIKRKDLLERVKTGALTEADGKEIAEKLLEVKGWSNVDDFSKAGTAESAKKIVNTRDTAKSFVIDTDELRKTLPGFKEGLEPEFHEASSKLTEDVFQEAIKNPEFEEVTFIAGGSGSGKSEVYVSKSANNPKEIIMDGTLAEYDKASRRIREAQEAGKKVKIQAVLSDIEDAKRFAKKRTQETGRVTPKEVLTKKHKEARATLLRLAKENPDVEIRVIENSPNNIRSLLFKDSKDLQQYLQANQLDSIEGVPSAARFKELVLKAQTPDKSLTDYNLDELSRFKTKIFDNKAGYALKDFGSDTVELANVFVVPEARGQGLSTTVIEDAIKTAKNSGAKTVKLDAYDYLEDLYKKFGFKTTRKLKFDPKIAGFESGDDVVLMELKL